MIKTFESLKEDKKEYPQPDIPICSECGEHAEFDENGSTCCGAGSPNPDPDIDMER